MANRQISQRTRSFSAADQYLHKIICDEIPWGLKRYMEYDTPAVSIFWLAGMYIEM
jgi:hypothetical protein